MAPPPSGSERIVLNRKTWPLFALGFILLIAAAIYNARRTEFGPNRFYSRPIPQDSNPREEQPHQTGQSAR